MKKKDSDSAQLEIYRAEVYAQRLNPRLVNVTFEGDDVLRIDFPAKFILRRKGSKPPPGSEADKGLVLADLTGHAKAVRALSDWVLSHGADRVQALTMLENTASERVLERASFVRGIVEVEPDGLTVTRWSRERDA